MSTSSHNPLRSVSGHAKLRKASREGVSGVANGDGLVRAVSRDRNGSGGGLVRTRIRTLSREMSADDGLLLHGSASRRAAAGLSPLAPGDPAVSPRNMLRRKSSSRRDRTSGSSPDASMADLRRRGSGTLSGSGSVPLPESSSRARSADRHGDGAARAAASSGSSTNGSPSALGRSAALVAKGSRLAASSDNVGSRATDSDSQPSVKSLSTGSDRSGGSVSLARQLAKKGPRLSSLSSRHQSSTGSLRGTSTLPPAMPKDPGDERTLRRPPKRLGGPSPSNSSRSVALPPPSGGGTAAAFSAALSGGGSSFPEPLANLGVQSAGYVDGEEAMFIARAREQAAEIERLKRALADRDAEIAELNEKLEAANSQIQAAELRAEFAEDMAGMAGDSAGPGGTPDVAAPKPSSSAAANNEGSSGRPSVNDKQRASNTDHSAPLRERPKGMARRLSIMALDAKRSEPLLGLVGSRALSRLDPTLEDGSSASIVNSKETSADKKSSSRSSAGGAVPQLNLGAGSGLAPRRGTAGPAPLSLSQMVASMRAQGTKVVQTPRGGSASYLADKAGQQPKAADGGGHHGVRSDSNISSNGSEPPESSARSTDSWQAGRRSRSSSIASETGVQLGRARSLSVGSSASAGGGQLAEPDSELLAALDSVIDGEEDSSSSSSSSSPTPAASGGHAKDRQANSNGGPTTPTALLRRTSSRDTGLASSETDASARGGSGISSGKPGEIPKVGSSRWQDALTRADTGRSTTSSSSGADSNRNWHVAYGGRSDSGTGGRGRSATLFVDGDTEGPGAGGVLVHVTDEATGRREVKAGTIDRLVELLAPGATDLPDQQFLVDFLATYPNFISGGQLINELLARWHDASDSSDASQRAIVRVRIINVLKKWLEQRPFDFDADERLLQRFVAMVRGPLASHSPQWAVRLDVDLQTKLSRQVALDLLQPEPIEAVLAAMKRPDAGLVHQGHSVHMGQRPFVGSEAVAWLCDHLPGLKDDPTGAVAVMQRLVDDGKVVELSDSADSAADGGQGAVKAKGPAARFQNRMKFYMFVHQSTDVTVDSNNKSAGGGGGDGGGRAPEPLVPPVGRPIRRCADVEPLEMARQMTLVDRELFVRVSAVELQRRDLSFDATEYVNHFNRVCYLIATEIVTSGASAEDRLETLIAFIRVGEHLERMRNYNGLFALIGGLHVSSVNRMRRMWSMLRDQHKEMGELLDRLIELTNPDHNYLPYRRQIAQDTASELPCIPYFGQYLRDLTHIRDGNPDTLVADDAGHAAPDTAGDGHLNPPVLLVNFEKMRMLARVTATFAELQKNVALYNFQNVPSVQRYMSAAPVLSEGDLYDISIKVEPRQTSSGSSTRKGSQDETGNDGGKRRSSAERKASQKLLKDQAASDGSSTSPGVLQSAANAAATAFASVKKGGGGGESADERKKSPGKHSKKNLHVGLSLDKSGSLSTGKSPRPASARRPFARKASGGGGKSSERSMSEGDATPIGSKGVSPREKSRKRRGSLSHRVAALFKPSKSATEREIDELQEHWLAMGIVPEEALIADDDDDAAGASNGDVSDGQSDDKQVVFQQDDASNTAQSDKGEGRDQQNHQQQQQQEQRPPSVTTAKSASTLPMQPFALAAGGKSASMEQLIGPGGRVSPQLTKQNSIDFAARAGMLPSSATNSARSTTTAETASSSSSAVSSTSGSRLRQRLKNVASKDDLYGSVEESASCDGDTGMCESSHKSQESVTEAGAGGVVADGGNGDDIDAQPLALLVDAALAGDADRVAQLLASHDSMADGSLDDAVVVPSGDSSAESAAAASAPTSAAGKTPTSAANEPSSASKGHEGDDEKKSATKNGGGAEESDDAGLTALYAAALGGSRAVVDQLLAAGARVDAPLPNDPQQTPLIAAVYAGHKDAALALLDAGASVTVANQHGATALHLAALNGLVDVARALLAKGADPSAADESGFTPAHMAALRASPDVLQVLLEAGASGTALDTDGRNPLHHACGSRPPRNVDTDRDDLVLRCAQQLAARAPEAVHVRDAGGAQPLHWCASRNHNLTSQFLVQEAGADVNARDTAGRTPLFRAFQSQASWSAKMLLEECSASPAIGDEHGDTPVHWAARNGYSQLTERLLARGGGLVVNSFHLDTGNTPMHEAARTGESDVFDQLLAAGGLVSEPNADGETPVVLAARRGGLGGARILWSLRAHVVSRLATSVSANDRTATSPVAHADKAVRTALRALANGETVAKLSSGLAQAGRQTAQESANRLRQAQAADRDGSPPADVVVEWRDAPGPEHPLMAACSSPDARSLLVLMAYEPNLRFRDPRTGDTVLHRCVRERNAAAVAELLKEPPSVVPLVALNNAGESPAGMVTRMARGQEGEPDTVTSSSVVARKLAEETIVAEFKKRDDFVETVD